jgi:hypothetical protein
MGLNADEASVSSHAVNKDDETLDEDGTHIQDLGPEPASSMDIPKEEEAAAPAPVEEVPVKMEKTDDEPTAEPEPVEPHDPEENAQLAVGSEDKQDEVTSPRKAGGKGKKRLLKGLDVSEKDAAEALGEGEDDGPRYQTNRAAAMLAKSKLNVAATATTTAPMATTTTTTTAKEAAPAVPTNAAKEPSRRGGWNRGTGRGAAVSAAANARLVPVVIEWVQCDTCGKWRSVSPSIGSNSLPDQWVCADNTWDTKFNHCEAPEQTEEEAKAMYDIPSAMGPPSLDPPRVKRESSDAGGSVETPSRGDHEPINRGGRGGGRGRGGARGRRGMSANSNANNASDDSGDDDEAPTSHRASRRNVNYAQADDPDYGRSTQKRRSSGVGAAAGRGAGRSARDLNASFATAAAEEVAIAAVDWVQCTKCAKWRKVPPHIDVNSLPDVWLCNMNNWNPAVAKCSAPEEVDEPVETPTAMATMAVATTPGRGHAGGGRGGGHNAARSAQHQAILQQMIAANAAAMAAAANAPPLAPGEIKRTQWVQCERKNCQKWRKVPAYIDISKFPAKWYCDLNFWSPDRAFCDVAEDVDSDEERKRKEARNNRNLLLGSNKGSAQLSYRRIIYGNDGKVRAQFAEKTKLGNGIFTYPVSARRNVSEDEEETHYFYKEEHEPVRRVSYWWSTSFDDRLHQLHPHSLKVNETAPGPQPTTTATATTTAEPATTSTSRKEATKEAAESFEFSLSSSSSSAAAAASETPQPVVSSYLIDTARRLHQMATGAVPAAWTTPHLHDTRALDAIDHVNSLTLYQRMTVETVVVRTLLTATTMAHVLFTELMAMLRDAQFLDPVHDACRFFLIDQKPAVVDVVHRMEERGEVEVAYTRDNKLVITLLPSMETLKQELAARRACLQAQWQQQHPRRSAAFDPRQRKCFQGKYAVGGGGGEALGKAIDVSAAASTGAANNSNNNNGTATAAPTATAAAAANAMANVSDNTLRAVAMANNLPFRTNEDGSFVAQYPSSGPFKIPLSSAVVANLRAAVAPVLSYEESMIVAAAFSNGKASSSSSSGSAAQGGAHGGAAGAANGPGGLGPGGRGKRGGGGGGRGRGRGRGGAAATAPADGSAAAAAATERPGAGRGATKRAAKAAADAAAAAAAAAALATSPAPAAASPAPLSATATPSTDAAEAGAEKKGRKPQPKRTSPSGADDANSDGADAAMAVDATASMDDDDDADSVGSQSSGPSTLEQVPKADDDADSSSDDEDPDDADGDKTQSDDDDADDGDADADDDGGDSSDGDDGDADEKSTGSRASAAKNAPREDDGDSDDDNDDDSDDDNAKGDEANAASGSDDDSQHGDAKAADDATAATSEADHDDGDDAAPAATGAMDVDDGDAAVVNGEDQTTHTAAEDATLDGAASDRASDSDGDVDAEPGDEQPSSTGGVEAKNLAASVTDEGIASPAVAEDAAPSSAMDVDEEATAQ